MIHLSAGACSENRAEGAPGAVSHQTIHSNFPGILRVLRFSISIEKFVGLAGECARPACDRQPLGEHSCESSGFFKAP
jgi:hypothetical protein